MLAAIVMIIVALIAAVVLASSAAKPAQPPAADAKTPTTQDGKSAVRYYGTCWIDTPAMLAWKIVGREPIQTKAGKK